MASDLPVGIWYEEPRQRWRVRLYRNQRAWVKYYRSEAEALVGHAQLKEQLAAIPRGLQTPIREVASATFRAVAGAVRTLIN